MPATFRLKGRSCQNALCGLEREFLGEEALLGAHRIFAIFPLKPEDFCVTSHSGGEQTPSPSYTARQPRTWSTRFPLSFPRRKPRPRRTAEEARSISVCFPWTEKTQDSNLNPIFDKWTSGQGLISNSRLFSALQAKTRKKKEKESQLGTLRVAAPHSPRSPVHPRAGPTDAPGLLRRPRREV